MNHEGHEETKVHEENRSYFLCNTLSSFVLFVLMGFVVVFRSLREIRGKFGLGEQRWIITNEDFEAKKKQLLWLYTGLHLPASFIKGLNPWVKLAGRFLMR